MKRSRFTNSQIMEALKRAEAGVAVQDLARELGVALSPVGLAHWVANSWFVMGATIAIGNITPVEIAVARSAGRVPKMHGCKEG